MGISAFFRTDAVNIEQSLLTAKKSTDGLRTLATSVEQKAELLGKRANQLSALNFENTSIFKALFEAFQHYQGLASEFRSVLPLVTKVQDDIENYKSQHELPKSSRNNKTPGAELAKLSTAMASNASLTLASCLKKKAEIDSASSSPLNEKALEVLSALDPHEDIGIQGKGIARPISPVKLSEVAHAKLVVTRQIGHLDHGYKSVSARTTPNASRLNLNATPNASRLNLNATPTASRLNLSENLVASSSPEQALTVVSIKISWDEITDIEGKLSLLLKKAKDEFSLVEKAIEKLDSKVPGFSIHNENLLTLRNNWNSFISNATMDLSSISRYQKSLVNYLLTSQEQRNPKAPDSQRSLELTFECVDKARGLLAGLEDGFTKNQNNSKNVIGKALASSV